MRKEKYLNISQHRMRKHFKITDEEWAYFTNRIEYKEYKKGTILTNINEIEDSLFILLSGYVRFYFKANGNEYTISYVEPSSIMNNLESFMKQEPSKFTIEATTDIHVFKISHKHIMESYDESHLAERVGRIFVEIGLIRRFNREVAMQCKSAKERYLDLLSEHPKLIKEINQKEIAAFICITPESFSRLKKKIKKDKTKLNNFKSLVK